MGVGTFSFRMPDAFTNLEAGQAWLLALMVMQLITEHFVFSYKSTWATESPWASEWGDYYSYWGHHLTTVSLVQILFPAVFSIPIIQHFDFVKIAAVALTNTTLLWQIPRLERYFMREHWTYEFLVNSMQHGGNLFCLGMYIWRSQRPLRDFSFWHTLSVPLSYTLFILWRVSSGRSTMRYYLPEGMGTPPYTVVVGAMWIMLQFVTELVVLQIVLNLKRVPRLARRGLRAASVLRDSLLSTTEKPAPRSWNEVADRVLQQEELLFMAPLVRRLSRRDFSSIGGGGGSSEIRTVRASSRIALQPF
eukprot:TRINITY_DN6702_c1_g1_i1.p1 TRINITY_DN6702_c1_g1~~TRINITY_DN6702_c1_g1_i1.p1  ORF type:complete len:343 (-),score=95.99 TRINITY_DN6702_c1_g1_i1:379-1293(-)